MGGPLSRQFVLIRADGQLPTLATPSMGRLDRPDGIAAAARYLASDAATFIIGSDLVIDGELLAG